MAEKIKWFIEFKYPTDTSWYKFGETEYDVRSEASNTIQELRAKESTKTKHKRQFRLNSR